MKNVLITGASRGIGRSIALKFAEKKYRIVLNYKENHEAAMKTQSEIIDLGAECLTLSCDVSKIAEVEKMYHEIKSIFGSIDILVNNAGVARGGLLQYTTDDDYDFIMDTNLRGVYNVSKAFVSDMIDKKSGRIINISSMWGEVGAANETLYSASKAAVIGFTKALAKELSLSNITVNCISPGAIMTDMLRMLPDETLKMLAGEIPLGGIGKGQDIASVAAFLASDEASYITGQIINVSGGLLIH